MKPTVPPIAWPRRLWRARKAAFGRVAYRSGLAQVYEWLAKPSGATILSYHSVAQVDQAPFIAPWNHLDPAAFAQQLDFLHRHRRVVSMSDLVEMVAAGGEPDPRSVCITFDDGYADNFTVAAPMLERYRMPATLYLLTGYTDRCENQWADTLHWAFNRRQRTRLELSRFGLQTFDLESAAQVQAAWRAVHDRLLEGTYAQRRELLDAAVAQLDPPGSPPRLMLDWDQVISFSRRYPLMAIGGHSRNHLDLSRHVAEHGRFEIDGCAEDLDRMLGKGTRHWAFPYNRWSPAACDHVRQGGWLSACGMGTQYRIAPGSDLFAMPRVESPPSVTDLGFQTSGAFPGILRFVGS
jgi:peptidoglycan/xylan/chitin deacetylase (PgdA/CDA1 family)